MGKGQKRQYVEQLNTDMCEYTILHAFTALSKRITDAGKMAPVNSYRVIEQQIKHS